MQDEAKEAITKYLDSIEIPNGYIRYTLLTENNPWYLAVEYYELDSRYKVYEYTIEFDADSCKINTVPAWADPIEHKTVLSLMRYISRYNY